MWKNIRFHQLTICQIFHPHIYAKKLARISGIFKRLYTPLRARLRFRKNEDS